MPLPANFSPCIRNPATDVLNTSLTLTDAEMVNFRIVNAQGQTVMLQNAQMTAGTSIKTLMCRTSLPVYIPCKSLPAGKFLQSVYQTITYFLIGNTFPVFGEGFFCA